MKWIHQVCSEITRGQIRQITGKERYAFECRQCSEPSKTTGTIVPGTPDETVPPPSSEVPDRAERSHRVRRGKRRHPTEDHKETRRRRKRTIRENRRAECTKHKPQKTRRIVTWNLQGISTRDQNRSGLRKAVEHARQQNWKAVMISEIRSDQEGIISLGDIPNQAVVINSQKFSERVTAVQIGRLRLIATYQPLWSKGPEENEKFRKDLENELARTPKESAPILRGDWNAQVGRGSQRQGIIGKYGLKTETNEAGESLLDWCEGHQLQHVKSYFPIRSRGTWFNQMHRRWYELDGFLMRASDRHQMVHRVATAHEMALSNHKSVWIDIWREQKNGDPE